MPANNIRRAAVTARFSVALAARGGAAAAEAEGVPTAPSGGSCAIVGPATGGTASRPALHPLRRAPVSNPFSVVLSGGRRDFGSGSEPRLGGSGGDLGTSCAAGSGSDGGDCVGSCGTDSECGGGARHCGMDSDGGLSAPAPDPFRGPIRSLKGAPLLLCFSGGELLGVPDPQGDFGLQPDMMEIKCIGMLAGIVCSLWMGRASVQRASRGLGY